MSDAESSGTGFLSIVGLVVVVIITIALASASDKRGQERIQRIEQRTGCKVEREPTHRNCTPFTTGSGRSIEAHWLCCPEERKTTNGDVP